MKSLRSFTPALCELMDVTPPQFATEPSYLSGLKEKGTIKKALIFAPDAFGEHAFKKIPELYHEMLKASTHQAELLSIYPPKTPVCFASLFTGGTPEQHGIKHYEKPVLTCDTLFDALVRSGKNVAIIAVRDSSIDLLFKGRPIDYFSMDYDPLVLAKALELLNKNEHDVIVVYHQEYDDLLHDSGLFSELAINALHHHVESWKLLVREAARVWKKDFCVAFTPDHGGHINEQGISDHGKDCPEDMELRHFFFIK